MNRQQPVVLLSFHFFRKYISECEASFITLESKEYRAFLYNLLFGKSTIYIDRDIVELFTFAENEQSILSSYVLLLMRTNRVRTLDRTLPDYIAQQLSTDDPLKPDYILADIPHHEARKLNETYGTIVLSTEFNRIPESVYAVQLFDFEANKPANISDCLRRLPRARNIIIEDPYLYSETSQFIEKLILELIGNQPKSNQVSLMIIVQASTFLRDEKAIAFHERGMKTLDEVKSRLESQFGATLRIDICQNDRHKMHDRHIMSNAYWVTSGHSFKNWYNTNTTWISKPLARYYPKFMSRLRFATKFMRDSNIECSNSLVDFKD